MRLPASTENPLRPDAGLLLLPMVLFVVVILATGKGTALLLRHWREMAELQMRLDVCVGDAAMELREAIEFIEDRNDEIQCLQCLATQIYLSRFIYPAPYEGLRRALQAEGLAQKGVWASWLARQAKWLAEMGCDEKGGLAIPLPNLPFEDRGDGHHGPKGMEPTGETEHLIRAWKLPRFAAAKTFTEDSNENADWTYAWIPVLGAGIPGAGDLGSGLDLGGLLGGGGVPEGVPGLPKGP